MSYAPAVRRPWGMKPVIGLGVAGPEVDRRLGVSSPPAAYHMLKDGTFYEDLGAAHFDRRRPDAQARRLVKRLAELGFSVELKSAVAAS